MPPGRVLWEQVSRERDARVRYPSVRAGVFKRLKNLHATAVSDVGFGRRLLRDGVQTVRGEGDGSFNEVGRGEAQFLQALKDARRLLGGKLDEQPLRSSGNRDVGQASSQAVGCLCIVTIRGCNGNNGVGDVPLGC